MRNDNTISEYYQHQAKYGHLIEKISTRARQKMFASFMRAVSPTEATKVLDVGVTVTRRGDCNFFERMYPYPQNITAVGLENASFLEQEYPGLKFVQADAVELPFPDKTFDLAVSWAVIEHIGNRSRQKKFLGELDRVSHSFFVTAPNRWYPIEFHTVTPFIHWLPPRVFHRILKLFKMDFYATEEALNLLSERELLDLLPVDAHSSTSKMHFRLFGGVSNLVIYVGKRTDNKVNAPLDWVLP